MEELINLSFDDNSLLASFYGEKNYNLKFVAKKLGVNIYSRGSFVNVSGDRELAKQAACFLEFMYKYVEEGRELTQDNIEQLWLDFNNHAGHERKMALAHSKHSSIQVKTPKRTIYPYTENQYSYLDMMEKKDVVFGIGSAGTGKTYLAVAKAVSYFIEKKVSRIILCRPAVEAGEKLGFLPGDMKEKVDPYLQPLYDSLYEMMDESEVERYFQNGTFQIAPLAFMRGRTLNNSFIILDEAQNATPVQMKMFLTRLGYSSKMAITGDLTQVDLENNKSGLLDAIEKLKKLEEIGIMEFDSKDVVRHPLTTKIIEAYDR
jgi:phosphate starvation-inducible PhoH-like protein